MSFDYNEAAATAKELITFFGESVQLIKDGSGGGYNADGTVKPDEADTIIVGICTPILRYTRAEVDGQNIQHDDGYVYFDCTETPEINMTLTINNETHRVVAVGGITSAAGVVVFRKLQVRR